MLCPVCGAEYVKTIPEYCSVCGWDLTSDTALFALPEIYEQKAQAKINWARQMWQVVQARESEYNSNGGIDSFSLEQNGANKKNQNLRKIRKQQAKRKNLNRRVDELQAELRQATIERFQLRSQLEWVLYRLEQLNPEVLTKTLYRIEEQLNTMPTPEAPMSEVGIDYNPLINLLAAGKWRKADELTWDILLQVTLREDEGWLRLTDIENFPCTDISTIDWLWEYYSNGLFGLNAQRRIWESVGGQYGDFCDRLGWRDGENWKYYDELSFNYEAPEGHLPVIIWRRRACYGVGKMTAAETFFAFISRLAVCVGVGE
ncbi:MAG: GUN4 domain-containing protein [Microcoleaceae cyanobacterium MO_207.B10]|nr:GUN4 domain-containing protein [Microcoleaceae cyanobacterium MO_207.B10]